MQFLIFDPATHFGFARGQHDAPGFDLAANQAECTDEQFADPAAWMLQNGAIVAAPPAAPPSAAELTAYAAAKRYAVETGGITVDGATIQTDRESQAMIANAYAYVQASGAAAVTYKATSGWVTLDADQIKAVALAVGAHVQAAFAEEATLAAAITASPRTVETIAAIDAAGWPANG